MVIADIGDQADFRQDDIGGIQPSPQSHFDYGKINFILCKMVEGHGAGHFKERWFDGFEMYSVAINKICYFFFIDLLTIDSDPLPKAFKMGRSIESCFITSRLQNRGKHVRAAALAIGSAYVN
jgi:hypothetical protein